ncbi:MAG: LytS/YhcK type 5TM receptor domain-containing protein, partial [Verrucomicrobiota bacterium]
MSSLQFGILTGIMALVSMFVPVVAEAGYFDSRSGVIGTGALLRGPVAALVSLPLPLLYRFYVGGSATIPGLLEILLPALFGSLCHLWIVRKISGFKISCVIASSLLTGLATTLIVFGVVAVGMPEILELMPGKAHMLLFILNAPVSMAVLSSLIVVELRHFQAVDTLEETEKRMLHSQKMAAVGQLSRKLAHNFANSLNIILGNAQLAKAQNRKNDTVQDLMDEIIAATTSVSELTGELLAFSSRGSMITRRIKLGKCLQGIQGVINEAVSSGVTVEVKIIGDEKVNIDPDRIEQAIVHIAVNANEAMFGKGKLT